jgi:nucleoside diphosphate kinase
MRESVDEWRNCLFGLISPDAIRRQLAPKVLDRLREVGVVPSGWCRVRIGGAQIDEVADIQKAGAGQTFRYRPLDVLFASGPAIALRLADQRDRPAEQLYADVQGSKGRTTPGVSDPGTIRHELGMINAVLSLVHLSDSPANSDQESRAILTGVPAGPDGPWAPADTLAGYLDLLAATQPPEQRDFTDVLTAVRGRIIGALWNQLSETGRRHTRELVGSGALAAPDAGARIAAELAPGAAHHPLADVLRLPFRPGSPPVDMTDVQALLRLHGCGLDPWELVVLSTSLYFEPTCP